MSASDRTRWDGATANSTSNYVARPLDDGCGLLVPLHVAREDADAIKAAAAAGPAHEPVPGLLVLLDGEHARADAFGPALSTEQLRSGLLALCLELAKLLAPDDADELRALARWHTGDHAGRGMRTNAPDWEKLIDAAFVAERRAAATRAITLFADELEHGRLGAAATCQARRWWRLAELCGSERARTRLAYIRIRSGDSAAARVARDACIKLLRSGQHATQQDLVKLSKTTLLALEAALTLADGELAALVLRHLAHRDLVTTDEDKLARLRALASGYFNSAAARAAPAEPDTVRVIRSHVPSSEPREKDILARLAPLMAPLPLAPWPLDLRWADALDAEFPWMSELTEQLRRQATMRMSLGGKALRIGPVLMVGSAGIGKTSYLRRLGELTGVPSMMQSLAGSNDNMALKGTARGWSSARPGVVLEFMAAHACPNPIVLLDEIDKASHETRNGNAWNTLLGMLEPSSASRLPDEFVLGEVDYAQVNWLCTANEVATLPGPLRSRLKIVKVAGPQPGHFGVVLANLLRAAAAELGVRVELLPPLSDDLVEAMRAGFARAPDMRVLARVLRDTLARGASWRPARLH